MLLKNLLIKKSNRDLKLALAEIKEWTDKGILEQSGMLFTIHEEYEKKTGAEQSLRDTKTEIVIEIGKRLFIDSKLIITIIEEK